MTYTNELIESTNEMFIPVVKTNKIVKTIKTGVGQRVKELLTIGVLTSKEIVELVNIGNVCKVETFNEETKQIELKTVVAGLLTKKDSNVIKLTIEEDDIEYTVTSTDDHRFYTNNRGWIEAKDLTDEDDIQIYYSIK